MAKFDQRGQHVINQINADSIGSVNFGKVQTKNEFITELRKLLPEIENAVKAGAIEAFVSDDIKSHINKAIIEAEKPEPKKKSILDNIEGAKSILEGVTSATSLITALIQAAKLVGGFFL